MNELLQTKIIEFGEYLIKLTNNEECKLMIEDKIQKMTLYEILMFITFLNYDKINEYLNQFMVQYEINDTIENRQKIIEKLEYFISVKEILCQ